jgi:hypothetical protein
MPADNPSPEEEGEYEERQNQHGTAKDISGRLGLPSYFEEHEEDGDMFLDGYVYAPPAMAVEALKALKDAGVEVDIIDVEIDNQKAARRLAKTLGALDWAREINV